MNVRIGNTLQLGILVLGLTAIITQIIIIREVVSTFHGNELTIGLALGCWMVLTALGALAARWRFLVNTSEKTLVFLFFLLGSLPVLTVLSISLVRSVLFPAGMMVDAFTVLTMLSILLAPFCLVSGYLFPVLTQLISTPSGDRTDYGYALDSAGGMAGALLFNLVLVFFLGSYQVLALVLAINVMFAIAISLQLRWKFVSYFLAGSGLALAFLLFFGKVDKIVNSLVFKGQEIIEVSDSPYSRLMVTKIDGQLNLYSNGVPLVSGNDPVQREESVHLPLLLHGHPERVLLISGGLGGTLGEIRKYPVRQVDFLEIDPRVVLIADRYGMIDPFPELSIINKDPRRHLSFVNRTYDAILINAPEPLSAEMNRLFTLEFFRILKSKLNVGGIISLSLPAGANYMSDELIALHSTSWTTLSLVFSNIRLIPGSRNYLVASDRDLAASLLTGNDSITTLNQYVNPYYLNEELMNMKADRILDFVDRNARPNRDLRPAAYQLAISSWLSHFGQRISALTIILLVLLILFILILKPYSLGLFVSGFSGVTMEFLLILWFQVMFGYAYWMVGLVFALFMAGLTIGSMKGRRMIRFPGLKAFLITQSGFALVIIASVGLMKILAMEGTSGMLQVIFTVVFTVIFGTLVGLQFSHASLIMTGSTSRRASGLYSADLLGSAIGLILISLIVVPAIGIMQTGLATAGLNLVCVAVMLTRAKMVYLYK